MMKTPSASTVKEMPGISVLTQGSQPQLHMDMAYINNVMTIEQNKVSNAVEHEIFLKDE